MIPDPEAPGDLENTKRLIENFCTEEWQYLIAMNKKQAKYKKNETIFREGDKIQFIHIIDTGKVKIFSVFNKEKERIIRLAADEKIIGHRGIGEDFTYSVSATALTSVTLTCIPVNVFKSVLKANNLFCYYFMLFFAEELRRSERHIKDLASMTVTQRVAKALSMNVEAYGFKGTDRSLLDFTLSRTDLSKIAGTTYETVIRVLGSLNDQRIIRLNGKKIHILDKDRLKSIMFDPGLEEG